MREASLCQMGARTLEMVSWCMGKRSQPRRRAVVRSDHAEQSTAARCLLGMLLRGPDKGFLGWVSSNELQGSRAASRRRSGIMF